jgi:uncharacterized protein (DUF983 family)
MALPRKKSQTNSISSVLCYFPKNESRTAAIDSKATTIVGYSGAILAFLILQLPTWTKATAWELIGISLAALAAAVACVYAFSALRGARDWEWFSERQWFPKNATLQGAVQLKRHYLKCMHGIKQSNHRITNQKADSLIAAQLLVSLAAIILGLTLTVSAIRASIVSASSLPSESCLNLSLGYLASVAPCRNLDGDCWKSHRFPTPIRLQIDRRHYQIPIRRLLSWIHLQEAS